MKIGIFQDVHANLPAFKKAIEVFREHGCEKVYHVGDLVGIGPHPKEVFELASMIDELNFIMGNHDYWYAFGLPSPRPHWMSIEEVEHQTWTHSQIGEDYRKRAQSWKFVEELKIDNNWKISFLHYGYDEKQNWFKSFVKNPNSGNLNELFDGLKSDMIFYGHNHESSDISGNSRYVNLGSAGCHNRSEVRLGILDISDTKLELQKLSCAYEDDGLLDDFEIRKVPAREFITQTFITR